jgi:hypothetical protein
MAQRKPEEKATLDRVLKLVDQLSPEEQDQLVDEIKLRALRRAVEEGEESIRQHGTLDGEEVFTSVINELRSRKAAE